MNTGPNALGYLFRPHQILPSQVGRERRLTPSQALLEALVEEALRSVVGHATAVNRDERSPRSGIYARYRIAQEAHDWFLSEAITARPFSFLFCCQHLNISPKAFRRYAREAFAKVEPPPERILYRKEVRVWPMIQQNHLRAAEQRPSWLARVQIRTPGRQGTVRAINLQTYAETKEEALRIAYNYITSDAWRQHIPRQTEGRLREHVSSPVTQKVDSVTSGFPLSDNTGTTQCHQ